MSQIARAADSVSRRSFFKIVIAGAGAACLAGGSAKAWAAETPLPKPVKIAIMSDLHYFSTSLWSDCPDYTTAENSDRKMFKESGAILDAALASIVAARPDIVIVPGDLTKDSEVVCHEEAHAKIAAAREQLKAAGVDTKFFVINGNHDVNNTNGLDFSSGAAEQAELANPARFREIWADCGYGEGSILYAPESSSAGSLSYITRPIEGITLIAVDSCKYSADQTSTGTDEHETSGVIGADLLAWITANAAQARANGDVVVVAQHHGVVPHFDDEPTLLGEYLVDNYETVAPAYADAGVSVVFTGHMHANDISSYTSSAGSVLHDIETDSLATYPSYIRTGEISWTESEGSIDATLSVDVAALGAVAYGSYADRIPGAQDIADITAYGKERTLTQSVVDTLAKEVVSGLLAQMAATGGIKPAIAGLLGASPDELDAQLFGLVAGILPTTFEEGMRVALASFNFSIWFDTAASRVKVDQFSEKAADAILLDTPVALGMGEELEAQAAAEAYSIEAGNISFYIDAASFAAFFGDACANIDTAILGNPDSATPLVGTLVDAVLNYAVDQQNHTVLGLVDYAYQTHLMGAEACEAWAEEAMAKVAGGEGFAEGLLMTVLRSAVNTSQSELTNLLSTVALNAELLVMKGNAHFMTTLALNVLKSTVKNAGDLVGFIANDGELGNLIPDMPELSSFAHSALYTLSHDTNEASDHSFTRSIHVKTVQPGGGTDGSGDGNGSDNVNPPAGDDAGNANPPAGGSTSQTGSQGTLPQTGDDAGALLVGAAAVAGAGAIAVGTIAHMAKEDR